MSEETSNKLDLKQAVTVSITNKDGSPVHPVEAATPGLHTLHMRHAAGEPATILEQSINGMLEYLRSACGADMSTLRIKVAAGPDEGDMTYTFEATTPAPIPQQGKLEKWGRAYGMGARRVAELNATAERIGRAVADSAHGCKTPGELASRVCAIAQHTAERRNAIHICVNAITKIAHQHEVQKWLDVPGSDEDKLAACLELGREALYHVQRD